MIKYFDFEIEVEKIDQIITNLSNNKEENSK